MPDKITLTIIEGNLKGEQFSFDSRTTCIIGRAPDCNIKIPNDQEHSSISRYHCLLDINPPNIRIRDFGSLHGTYVNDKCIGKREENQTPEEGAKLDLAEYDLKDGDLIKLSNSVFKVNIEKELQVSSILTKPMIGSLEGYTKLKLLGKGGCGEVFLARKEATGELVALKTLLPQVAVMPYMKERFLGEARRTKMLNHPNLVQLQDYCFSDGVFFFTMEYCDRGSVINLIKKRSGKL